MEISSGTLSHGEPPTIVPTIKCKLLWRANLSSFGLKTSHADLFSGHFSPRATNDLLSFLDENVLSVSFPVSEGRKPPGWRTFRIVQLDGPTGKVVRTRDWLVPQREIGAKATRTGKIAIHTRGKLELYSQTFEKIAEYSLPNIRRPANWEDYPVYATPNRDYLVVAHFLDKDLTLEWLNPETLAVEGRWGAPSGEFGMGAENPKTHDVSGTRIVAMREELIRREYGSFEADCQIFLADRNGPLRKLLELPQNCSVQGARGAQWVDDRILYLPTLHGLLFLDAETSRILLTETLGKSEFAFHGRTSPNGRQFVIPVVQWKGGISFLDIGEHLVLSRLVVYEIFGDPHIKRSFVPDIRTKNIVAFALSPDGRRLAVVRGDEIELYSFQESSIPNL